MGDSLAQLDLGITASGGVVRDLWRLVTEASDTNPVVINATTEATAQVVLDPILDIPASYPRQKAFLVVFCAPALRASVANTGMTWVLWDNLAGASLGKIGATFLGSSGQDDGPATIATSFALTSGVAQQLAIRAYVSANNVTVRSGIPLTPAAYHPRTCWVYNR